MAEYTVYRRPSDSMEEAIFLREGFSMGAFFFTFLWALWHRLWFVAVVLLALTILVAFGAKALGVNETVTALLGFAANLIFGFEARNFKGQSLLSRGYGEAGLAQGRTLEEAELRYFHGLKEVPVPTAKPLRPLQAPDTLGIFSNV